MKTQQGLYKCVFSKIWHYAKGRLEYYCTTTYL